MSPEQAQGLRTDKRTDVWAFGCVLFEMLSGKRAFAGGDTSATLANVLARDPDWTSLPEQTPRPISRLLRRCLQKDRSRRLADIADARLELDEALSTPAEDSFRRPPIRARERLGWVTAAACLSALLVGLAFFMRIDRPEPRVVLFDINVTDMAGPFFMSLSPDGRRLAYIARTISGDSGLWVRWLDSLEARLLPGTAGAGQLDWSPDSRFIAFAAGDQLKKIDVTGGLPQTLTDLLPTMRRLTWSSDGVILIANGQTLSRVPDSGGEAIKVTELDGTLEETLHSTPWFLPDRRHFLFTAWSDNPANRAVYVGSLDSKDRKRLMSAESKAIYSPPGYILFRLEGRLMVQPFDAERLELTGDARILVEPVSYNRDLGQSAFSASTEGTLAYVTEAPVNRRLVWVDRRGKPSDVSDALSDARNPGLSSDGQRIAYYAGTTPDIWVYDIDRELKTLLTNDPSADRFPLLSPDGSRVVFASNRDGPTMAGLYEKAANGAVPERRILSAKPGEIIAPRAWTADGAQLIFESGGDFGAPRDIWVLSPDGKSHPYVMSRADERHPALSPDGRWLAYASNESGSYQVFVRPFPDAAAGKWPISSQGGMFPRWKGNGSELYYDDDGWIVAASVRTSPTFEVTRTDRLFRASIAPSMTDLDVPFDVSADGQRFLMSATLGPSPGTQVTSITVILNWPSLLQR